MKIQAARTLIVKILMVLVFTLVGLLICEGVLRLLPQESIEYKKVLEGDPLLGIPPSQPDPTEDFPQKTKPKDVYRIVVLGDSQTALSAGKWQSTYPEVLETLLNGVDLKGKRVEVHNAGAPGHSHYQYYLSLDKRLKQYDPDLVIVGFHIGNDFLDLYRNDDRPSLSFDGVDFVHKAPVFYKFHDPGSTNQGMLESSRLLQFVRVRLRRAIGYQMDRVRILWGIGKKAGEGNIAAAKFLYPVIRGYFVHQHIFRQSMLQILFLERFPKEQEDIDNINFRATQLIKATAERNGMELLYVPIPTKLQIEPDSDPVVLRKTLEVCNLDRNALTVEDRLYESFTSLLDAHGINHVDVRDALKKKANEGTLYDETYHQTVKSHEIVAKSLYEVIAPMLMSEDAL
jgi:hypothetical protein